MNHRFPAFRTGLSAAALAAVLATGLSLSAPAAAQVPLGGMVTGNDVARVVEIVSAYGQAEQRQDESGVWIRCEVDGIVYSISFLNCDETGGGCTTVQFRAWWEANGIHTVEMMNQWNRDRRFSAAYLDDSMNPTIEWDVNLAGGVTAVNFDDDLQWWHSVMREFRSSVINQDQTDTRPPGSK